jgi:hypothetical protein
MFDSILENDAAEMQAHVKRIAATLPAGSKQEAALHKIAHKMGVSRSRAKVLFYGETDCIRANELDRARALADEAVLDGAIHALEEAEQHHIERAAFYRAQREAIRGRENSFSARNTNRANQETSYLDTCAVQGTA